ncbi:MAG: TRAM domain-containing protein [Spirochaetota bacterium]
MGKLERLRIDKLVAGGEGLAFSEGRAVFVPGALPGELVEAEIVDSRRDWSRAELRALVETSPDRAEPVCPIYGECGGCNLQHLSYEAQLREKASMLRDIFLRTALFDPGEIATVPSPPFGYRNRLQLHFSAAGRLGFMRRLSNEIVEAPGCPIAVKALELWIEERAGRSESRDELHDYGVSGDRFTLFGQGDEVFVEGRHKRVRTQVAGERISFDLGGFFQSNLQILDSLVPEVVEGLEGSRAADLYAGVGLFAHFLSKRFSRVIMVEENRAALAEARTNAPGPANEYHGSSVEDWCRGQGARAVLDALVVDPPRSGLSAQVRAWIAQRRPRLLSYVSCDPVTLARDAAELVKAGYSLERLKLFDFYPQTGHLETLARFRLAGES